MTQDEREAFYDTELAPLLLALGQKAKEAGLSFVASVGWGNFETGSTVCLQEAADPTSRLTAYAARCKGNADHLIKMIIEDCEKYGNQSIYVHLLTYKLKPAAHAADVN